MQVNRDIIDTLVTLYMQALRKENFLLCTQLLMKIGNYGARLVVQDIPKGICIWYRTNETSI